MTKTKVASLLMQLADVVIAPLECPCMLCGRNRDLKERAQRVAKELADEDGYEKHAPELWGKTEKGGKKKGS